VTVALILTVLVFGTFVAAGSPVQLANLAVGVWFTEVLCFLGLPFAALQVLGRDPVRETALDSTTLRAVGLAFLVGCANYLAWAVPLMAAMQAVLPRKVLELFDGSKVFEHQSGPELGALVLGLSLAAPFCEEFFFRGVLQRALMKKLEPSMAVVLSALIFSAFHLDPVGFLARFELGVVFGLLAWRSGSIWPGIAAHAANNLMASALFLSSTGKHDDGPMEWKVLLGLLVGGNVLLALAIKLAEGRLGSPRPGSDEGREPVFFVRAALPWVVAGTITVGALLALDWRGVQLRLYEQLNPLPKKIATDPDLEALRKKARSGEVPLNDYYEARQLAAPPKSEEANEPSRSP
jgi:membrane protease YdiL (CAAX protease family)